MSAHFSFGTIIRHSLRHYWYIHLAMLLAVATTTTVLTGALTIGDSMRGSLKDLTLRRLGPIDHVVLSSSFLNRDAARTWAATAEFQSVFESCVPTLHFPAATLALVERSGPSAPPSSPTKAETLNLAARPVEWTSVALWGIEDDFSKLDWGATGIRVPDNNEIVVNRAAAKRLGLTNAHLGSILSVRLGKPSDVPTESFIATKEDAISSLPRLRLVQIIEDEGVGRLTLTPGTEVPALVFAARSTLERVIPTATRDARSDEVLTNAWLLTTGQMAPLPETSVAPAWKGLTLSLADAGLRITSVQQSEQPYVSVSSTRMLLDDGQRKLVEQAVEGLPVQRLLTYLANDLRTSAAAEKGIPFSMVTALEPTGNFAWPLIDGRSIETWEDDEIVVNAWAAEDQGWKVGDRVQVRYFEPETVDGEEVEREVEFRIAGIAALTTPDQPYQMVGSRVRPAQFKTPPTPANDPWLTPEVPGVTDAASIEAWDLPFETADSIRPQDDDYWQFYRTTPKAFVTLSAGQRLWGSRFGELTGFRVSALSCSEAELQARLERAMAADLDLTGVQRLAVKRQGWLGSQGSTPFDVLFLMFSGFVIASSLLLLTLFVRLGLQQRAKELGLWLALGFSSRQVSRVWWLESALSAGAGIALGSGLGLAYAGVMAWLMRTAWVGAVASPFLHLHWTWMSLGLGGLGSLLVCSLVTAWSIRQAASVPPLTLLTERWSTQDNSVSTGRAKFGRWWTQPSTIYGLTGLSFVVSLGGLWAAGDTQAIAFMSAGMGILVARLLAVFRHLTAPHHVDKLTWAEVGQLNLARQPLRSLVIIGLVGIATFLILAVSAFRLQPTERGTAGFDYVARTNTGILWDLNSPTARQEWLERAQGSAPSQPMAAGDQPLEFFGFRFQDGEHASCNNPFQAGAPQVLGVSPSWLERFDAPDRPAFAWVATTAASVADKTNPWRLLETPSNDAIPVIIDKNTAWYSLKVYLPGSRFRIDYPGVGEVEFELVGLLDNSLLQGTLMISEKRFLELFPRSTGQRFFLIDGVTPERADEVLALGNALKDTGWQLQSTADVLANYLAVQNTYLSAFQSLGSLGLLLGTIGLVIAQFRSVLERRQELGLLQALGFSPSRIHQLITKETLRLMRLGFEVGLTSAAVGVLPHFLLGAADIPVLGLLAVLLGIAIIGWLAARLVGQWAIQGNILRALRNL